MSYKILNKEVLKMIQPDPPVHRLSERGIDVSARDSQALTNIRHYNGDFGAWEELDKRLSIVRKALESIADTQKVVLNEIAALKKSATSTVPADGKRNKRRTKRKSKKTRTSSKH